MAEHGEHSSPHGEHGVHLPDPSAWPLVVGVASFVLGAALIWWSRDPDGRLTGPLLGAGIVVLLVAIAGWAYDDSRMRRKAEQGELTEKGPTRFTQVVTFAVAEDQFEQARSDSGVLQAIDRSDSALRDLAGFQDLRIVASPTTVGPAQVLVETTWSGRDELATYEETRQTILDILNQHPEEVVPGSIQVFDMEVVRDTKEVGFRFSMAATASLFGALLVGGFMVGLGLTLFQEDRVVAGPDGGGGGETPAPASGTVVATDNSFNVQTLEAPPETEVTFTLKNEGQSPHNLAFYTDSSASTPLQEPESIGDIIRGGETDEVTFTTPAAGSYYFQCDLHPTQMRGTFEVKEGAPAPGAGGGAAPEAPEAGGVVATDNKFNVQTLEAPPSTDMTFNFSNEGRSPHNLAFYTDSSASKPLVDPDSIGGIIRGGESEEVSFTTPEAGSYYFQCDLHPTEMRGTFEVKEGASPPGGG